MKLTTAASGLASAWAKLSSWNGGATFLALTFGWSTSVKAFHVLSDEKGILRMARRQKSRPCQTCGGAGQEQATFPKP